MRNLDRSEVAGATLQGAGPREQMVSFRVEQTGENGDVTGYTQVELRGELIHGGLSDGDRVRIVGKKGRDGVLRPGQVDNQSTHSLVRVSNRRALKVFQTVMTLVVVVLFASVVIFILNA